MQAAQFRQISASFSPWMRAILFLNETRGLKTAF